MTRCRSTPASSSAVPVVTEALPGPSSATDWWHWAHRRLTCQRSACPAPPPSVSNCDSSASSNVGYHRQAPASSIARPAGSSRASHTRPSATVAPLALGLAVGLGLGQPAELPQQAQRRRLAAQHPHNQRRDAVGHELGDQRQRLGGNVGHVLIGGPVYLADLPGVVARGGPAPRHVYPAGGAHRLIHRINPGVDKAGPGGYGLPGRRFLGHSSSSPIRSAGISITVMNTDKMNPAPGASPIRCSPFRNINCPLEKLRE